MPSGKLQAMKLSFSLRQPTQEQYMIASCHDMTDELLKATLIQNTTKINVRILFRTKRKEDNPIR